MTLSDAELKEIRREMTDRTEARLTSEDRTDRALSAVYFERMAQRDEWGDEHDVGHAAGDWTRFIVRHLGRAEQAVEDGDRKAWRKQMVRVAALAVAAIEGMSEQEAR